MNFKKLGLATLAVVVFTFIFEMLWHGILMNGLYEATMSVWRPEEETNMVLMFLSQFIFALISVVFWAKYGRKGSDKKGVVFGLLAGLLFAGPQLASHCYLPIPLSISLLWMTASLIRGVGAGVIAAAIYK